MRVAVILIMLAGMAVAQGRAPGDFYPESGTGSVTNPPYARGLTVHGSVETNDVMIFTDRTGSKGRGTNFFALVHGLVTNDVADEAAARIAGDAALISSNASARAAIVAEALLRAQGDALALPRGELPGIITTSGVARAGYSTSSGNATNAGYADSTAFSTNAQTAVHAQTAAALSLPDGTWSWTMNGTNYVVTFDTTRVYVVSTNSQYIAGPPVGTIFHWNGTIYTNHTPFYSAQIDANDTFFVGYGNEATQGATTGWALLSTGLETVWFNNDLAALPVNLSGDFGLCTINYVPVTNATPVASAATVIIIAAQVETNRTDIAALEEGQAARPTFAATTNIVTALAGSGTADNIYTPVYAATTTIAVNATQAVYRATFGTAGAVTQSIAGLTVSATHEARWELWLNCTNPAALAPTWQSNLDWANGTPDMTVTGLYKFAMSTTGTRITGRQTYPTVHRWMSAPASAARNSNTAATLAMFQELIATADTSAYAYVPLVHDMQSPTLLRFSSYVYAVNASTNPITLKIGMGFPQLLAPTKEATLSTSIQLAVYAGERGVPKTFYCPALEKTNLAYVWPYVVFSKPYVGGRAVITLWQTKIVNELEAAAYAAGKRDW